MIDGKDDISALKVYLLSCSVFDYCFRIWLYIYTSGLDEEDGEGQIFRSKYPDCGLGKSIFQQFAQTYLAWQ